MPAGWTDRMDTLRRTLLAHAARLLGQGEDMHEVLGGAALVFAIRVVGAGLAYLSVILLVRWMGAYEFGIYTYAWSWALLLANLLPLGLNLAVIRFVSEYRTRGFPARMRGIVTSSRRTVAVASVGVSLLAIALVVAARGLIPDYYVAPIMIGLACVPVLSFVELYQGLARAFERVGLAFAPAYVLQPALLITGVGAMVAVGVTPTATLALSTMMLACVAGLAAQSLPLWRHMRRLFEGVTPRFHTKYWLAVAMPLLLTQSFVVVLDHSDILVLGALMHPDDVAAYYAALRTAGMLGFLLFAVAAIAAPKITRIHTSGSRAELQHFVTGMVRLCFWPSLAGAVVLISAGPFLLRLFDESFVDAYPALAVLVSLFLFRAATGPVEYILNMTGHQVVCARIYAVVALINIAANLALIPLLGILGAAVATTLANFLASSLMVVEVWRRLGIVSFVAAPEALVARLKRVPEGGPRSARARKAAARPR